MSAHRIASKIRRALKNEVGITLSFEQLRELADFGLLNTLSRIENEELCPAPALPTSSATTGSTNDVTARHRTSGRLPMPANDQSYIAALTAGA